MQEFYRGLLTLAPSVTFPREIYKSDMFNAIFTPRDGFAHNRSFANVKMEPYLSMLQFNKLPVFRHQNGLINSCDGHPGTMAEDRCYSPIRHKRLSIFHE